MTNKQLEEHGLTLVTLPERESIVLNGKYVPYLTAKDRGDTMEITLDARMVFTFPKDVVLDVLHFAANAMAVGAGYPCFGVEHKTNLFNIGVIGVGSPEEEPVNKMVH